MGSHIDNTDDNAEYGTIEFHGRLYVPYGTISRSIKIKVIDQCVGYV